MLKCFETVLDDRNRSIAAALLVFVVSCLFYSINLGRAPHPDEIYHILAARGLLEYGEPRIADGLYERVVGYTWLVSRMFALFGESLAAARLPSVVAQATLNTLLFVWLRREAGWRTATLAAGLFGVSPFALEIAQFTRFYALQSLFFVAGCLAVYEVTVRPARPGPAAAARATIRCLVALACLAVALYLQPTTLLGVAGLGFWLASAVAVPWLADDGVPRRPKILASFLVLVAAATVLAILLATGIVAELWIKFRWVPAFMEPRVNEFWFYHFFYIIYYPTLWPLVGFLSFAALAYRPRVAWFAMSVFAVGFLLNSVAGPKSLRYMAYAQPFLFVLLGLGLVATLPWIASAGSSLRRQIETHLAAIGLAGWRLPEAMIWGSLAFLLLANAAFLRTVALLAGITVPPEQPTSQWEAARSSVEALLDEVDVVVTMTELETLYFWGRYDVLFSPSRLSELDGQGEFALDYRTGRPVISTREALARLVDCTASGLLVTTPSRWRTPQLIDAETVNFIEQKMTRVDLSPAMQLIVFTWAHAPARTAAECATVREALAPGSG